MKTKPDEEVAGSEIYSENLLLDFIETIFAHLNGL